MSLTAMAHAVDPRKEHMEKVKPYLDQIEVFHNQVLVVTYLRPKVTAAGLHLPDSVEKEDQFQGKVGLVAKKGPMAFVDDKDAEFHGQDVQIGDWVCYRMSDGWPVSLGGVPCRVIEDTHIKGRVARPDLVY